MLRALIDFSLRRTSLVLILAVAAIAYAAVVLNRLPVDVFPELNAPTVVVMAEAPGFAAEEVEQYVVFPLESSVNGLPGVRRVRSASAVGLGILWVEFDWGADLYRARQLVAERLAVADEGLPPSVHVELSPISSITGEIMLLALSSPNGAADPIALRSYAEFELRTRLLAIGGVSQVSVIGGELPEYRVDVRQERLAAYGLSVADVVAAAKAAHSTAAGGYLADYDRLELPIRQTARVRSVDDVRRTLVKLHDGAPVTIGDVADVALAGAPRRGAASDSGVPAVVLSVQKAPGTNTLKLTAEIDRVLAPIEAAPPAGMRLNRAVFRQADFIERSIDNVVVVMRDAAIIVALILVLFLLNVRTTLITLTALPLSFAAAIVILEALGVGLNVMTLGGLAVAIGELVDDAIIDVENVFRRLKENAALPEERRVPYVRAIFEASNEIRSTVVYATVLIVLVFLPMMFLEGMEGRFFRPLGATYVSSIFASLLVALTVTPALCKLLLRGRLGGKHGGDGPLVRVLKRLYEPALRWSLRRRGTVFAVSVLLTMLAAVGASTFGTSFLPTFNEGTFTAFLFQPPGTSLEESDRTARGVEMRLRALDGVRSVVRRTGRAERDEHAEPPSASEIEVTVAPGADAARVRAGIDAILSQVPGITTQIGQPIEHRLSHVLSGTPAAVAVSVFGEDLDVLRGVAKEIEAGLKSVPGARDVNANRELLVSSLPIRYRAADLAIVGLTPADAAEQVEQAVYGAHAAQINEGVRRYDLVVRLHPDERRTTEDLASLTLVGRGGARVPLRDVADLSVERTPNLIARENARRKAVVSCNVAEGSNLGDLVAEVRRIADPIIARAGCFAVYGGQFEAQQSAIRTLGLYGTAALVLMLLLLQASTGSYRNAVLVMANLPLALIGGIVAVFVAESPDPWANLLALFGAGAAYRPPVLSLPSLVGFFTLFGIAVRNGILLVNHYRHIEEHEGRSGVEAVVHGSMERLVPILMTALTAALGLIPLAAAAGEPGSELLAPLSIVVLGGLVSSTFLNLIVVPAGYAWLHRRKAAPSGDPS
jgi:CzcA family heavy metal efflux pump